MGYFRLEAVLRQHLGQHPCSRVCPCCPKKNEGGMSHNGGDWVDRIKENGFSNKVLCPR